MNKRMLVPTVMMALMCVLFIATLIVGIFFSSKDVYEGSVIGHTEDSLIIEVEVKVSPEELIGYEVGDPYVLGGK